MLKKAITISGGFDSGCLPFILKKNHHLYDFIFFDYQQLYLRKEKEKAVRLAEFFGKPLLIIKIAAIHHDFDRRNFIFISELKKLGYSEIVMGNRNILPLFDNYKDSNFLYLKIVGFLFNIKIHLPITGWTKHKCIRFLQKNRYSDFYNCYKNTSDFSNCGCPNCKELRKIGFYKKAGK